MTVLVVDRNKNPLMPCHPARARQLLKEGKAAVFRQYPFTIILKDREGGDTQPVTVKLDPGSKTTGITLVAETQRGSRVIWAAELEHRGSTIKKALDDRRAIRRSRRNRHTRYRPARFMNRRRREGWLPPSLQSRIENVYTWARRLYKLAPVTALSMELVRFDTQALENPEISGVEYQQGELLGYEVREYLLLKWSHECAYCGAKDTRLEVEHIIPKSRGGTNRVSNLTIACHTCNQRKGGQTAAEFGHPKLQAQAKRPLKDAASVNATRWALWRRLNATGLSLECGSGGRTKYNRVRQEYPKAHWIDAACVGESGARVFLRDTMPILHIKATGHGRRQMCQTDKYGFPKAHRTRHRYSHGFRTGDMVKAIIPTGKYEGIHIGRVTIREKPKFMINGIGCHAKYCQPIHRADGYSYLVKRDYIA